jgi:hypothetical protein
MKKKTKKKTINDNTTAVQRMLVPYLVGNLLVP